MKKFILFSLLGWLVCYSQPVVACDVCNIYEYRPYKIQNYIGVFYHMRKFNGYDHLDQSHRFFGNGGLQMHELEGSGLFFEKKKQDFEVYQTFAIRGNFKLWKNLQMQVIVPYEHIQVYYNKVWSVMDPVADTTLALQGWGDLITAFDWTFTHQGSNKKHIIRPGFAVKWPTGAYQKTDQNGDLFDPEIQPGTASIDLMLRLNYLQLYQNGFGQSVSLNYKWNGPTQQDYQFANSFNGQLDWFYVIDNKKSSWVPKLGFYLESAGKNSGPEGEEDLTGGTTLLADVGIEYRYDNKWSFQVLSQPVLWDKRNGRQIGNAGRLNLALVRNL